MFVQSGNIQIHGLQLNSSGVTSCNNGDETDIRGRCNHTIKVGIDLGKVNGIGIIKANGQNLCAPNGPKSCEGNLHLTMVTPTRIKYSQNNGIVCGAAHGIKVEHSNCKVPTQANRNKNYNNDNNNNASNSSTDIDSINPGDPNSDIGSIDIEAVYNSTNNNTNDANSNYGDTSTCEGQAILCTTGVIDFNADIDFSFDTPLMGCTEDEEIENIETFVNGGGLYFGVVKYNATQTQFVNNRHTVDGLPCIFPFKYKNKMY